MATNAKYKRYDGTNWVEYHFATNAGQVSTTTGRKFLTASVTVNNNTAGTTGARVTLGSGDAANIEIDAGHIGWYTGTKPTTNYLSNATSVQDALQALDTAAKNAYDNVPSGILTTSNYSSTLGSVYQALDADLTAIAALTGTSGFLKKTAADTWSLDDTSYVATSMTINSKALNSNITLYGTDITMASNNPTTVTAAINAVASAANGISKSIVIDASGSDVSTLDSAYANTAFNTTNASIEITATSSTNYKLKDLNGNDINLADLKLGDTVFILDTNVPDRWLADIGTSGDTYYYTFAQLETYNMQWAAIASKPTTIAGYGITDAKIENGTITLGSNTITPITSHQSLANYVTLDGSQEITGNKDFSGTVKVGEGAFYFENDENSYLTEIKQATYGTHAVTANRTITLPNKTGVLALLDDVPTVTVSNSAPSSPSTGAIWFDTSTN